MYTQDEQGATALVPHTRHRTVEVCRNSGRRVVTSFFATRSAAVTSRQLCQMSSSGIIGIARAPVSSKPCDQTVAPSGTGWPLLKRPSADVVDGAISLFERQRSSGLGPVETDFELHPAIETSEPNQALTATLGGL